MLLFCWSRREWQFSNTNWSRRIITTLSSTLRCIGSAEIRDGTRQKKPLRAKTISSGHRRRAADGQDSLSAWPGSDCTVPLLAAVFAASRSRNSVYFYRKVCAAPPVTWMTAEKWLPTSGHKQSSAAFSLEPQTKDKESLSCQICVFHCSEVYEKTVCIIHSSELGGGGVGVNTTPIWLLLSPAGGGGRNRGHIARGFPDKRLCSAEVMDWLC